MSDLSRPASLKDLADVTRLPKPTLFRVLKTLGDLGYVSQDKARGNYVLGAKLFQLARGSDSNEIRRLALPTMEALHEMFNETVNLGVLQGDSVYYLHFIETTLNLRWQVRPGGSDPFYCTALGRAIVAALPEERQQQLLDREVFEPRTEATPTTRAAVAAALAQTAERGWAEDNEENDAGVCCFGIPLIVEGRPIAGVSVSLPTSRLTDDMHRRITDALLSARNGTLLPAVREASA